MKNKMLRFATLAFVASIGFGALALKANAGMPVADSATETASFAMETGAQVRTETPAGIRFITNVNATYKTALEDAYSIDSYTYEWGTELTFTTVEKNTYTLDAITKEWTDENKTSWYTTLANIPESDYLTDITAESYVRIYNKADGTLVATQKADNAQTRNLAWTASWALNGGYNDAALYEYTKAIPNTSVTLDKEGVAYLAAGREFTLSATVEPAGYGVAWRSSDESVATVDKNGKVTAVGLGDATITAKLGNAKATYEVSVKNPNDANVSESKLISRITKDSNYSSGVHVLNYETIYGRDESMKAYGIDFTGKGNNSASMYMFYSADVKSMNKSVIADWFDNNNATAITFDIILSEFKQLQLNGNNSTFFNGGNYTVSEEKVGDVTYYTYHVRITKEYYEANKTKAFTFRYAWGANIEGTTSASSKFFYIDNLVIEATK